MTTGFPATATRDNRERDQFRAETQGKSAVVELDRPVLVGRAPAPSEVRGLEDSAPAVLTVPSPGQLISRNHLLIELDEWSVLARNLSESNGTLLLREGEPARKIPSSEPVLLRAGDVLDLGDG